MFVLVEFRLSKVETHRGDDGSMPSRCPCQRVARREAGYRRQDEPDATHHLPGISLSNDVS